MNVIVEPGPERDGRRCAGARANGCSARLESRTAPMGDTVSGMVVDRLKRIAPSLLVLATVITVWWVVVEATQSPIFPTPWQVITGAYELAQDGSLWEHIGASLFRVGAGFGLAALLAIPLGLWMGWVAGAYRTFNPIFQMLRPISPIAWIPVAILWFGVGDAAPIFLIFLASVFPITCRPRSGVHNIERALPAGGANFGVSRAGAVSPGRSFPPCCRRSSPACGSRWASPGWWSWRPR